MKNLQIYEVIMMHLVLYINNKYKQHITMFLYDLES